MFYKMWNDALKDRKRYVHRGARSEVPGREAGGNNATVPRV